MHSLHYMPAPFWQYIIYFCFQMMGIIIPPRPAAILVMFLGGFTETAWLSTLNSYSGMTPPKRTRVSPSYYPADPLTQPNAPKVIRQNRSTFTKTKSNQGSGFRDRHLLTPAAELLHRVSWASMQPKLLNNLSANYLNGRL